MQLHSLLIDECERYVHMYVYTLYLTFTKLCETLAERPAERSVLYRSVYIPDLFQIGRQLLRS